MNSQTIKGNIIEPITRDVAVGPNAHVPGGTGINGKSTQFIVKDNPACGGGGAIQCTPETEVVVKVYDVLSGALVKDKANLLELLTQ